MFCNLENPSRRALSEDCCTWIDKIGYHTWVRSCFRVFWYNIITSNSVESISALSKDARKLLITMLIDFIRATTPTSRKWSKSWTTGDWLWWDFQSRGQTYHYLDSSHYYSFIPLASLPTRHEKCVSSWSFIEDLIHV